MEAVNWEKFRAKTRAFLREHEDHVAIRKVRLNKPLTETDVSELERMLAENVSDADTVRRAAEESHGLACSFARSSGSIAKPQSRRLVTLRGQGLVRDSDRVRQPSSSTT